MCADLKFHCGTFLGSSLSKISCVEVAGSSGRLQEEGNAGEGAQVGGLVVSCQLPFPLVPSVLEPDLHLEIRGGFFL